MGRNRVVAWLSHAKNATDYWTELSKEKYAGMNNEVKLNGVGQNGMTYVTCCSMALECMGGLQYRMRRNGLNLLELCQQIYPVSCH